jgi:hypothetical protein
MLSGTAIDCLRTRSTGYLQRSAIVYSDGQYAAFGIWRGRENRRDRFGQSRLNGQNWSEGSTHELSTLTFVRTDLAYLPLMLLAIVLLEPGFPA